MDASSHAARVPAIDWARGLAMVLMASDHASAAFNANRLLTDGPLFYDPATALPPLDFAYRWVSHFCAPAFLFLAGASLALSINRRTLQGRSNASIDRDLLIRGLIILAVDLTILHVLWVPGVLLLQVMFAIGAAMILMMPVRRLPPILAGFLAAVWLIVADFFPPAQMAIPHTPAAIARALFVTGGWIDLPDSWGSIFDQPGSTNGIFIAYPVFSWWAMMALGWTLGGWMVRNTVHSPSPASSARTLTIAGSALLIVFAVLRGFNGFGNLGLVRLDHSWVQWLHVSKYPPSLTFVTLELGLLLLVLAAAMRRPSPARPQSSLSPCLVFGQTAFFFYLAHIVILEMAARALGMHGERGLLAAGLATVAALLVLYPMCLGYRRAKRRRPDGLLRFF